MNPSGSKLGKYQIIREIARSNDIVFEAYDPDMNRTVAVKELNIPAGTTDQQKQDRIDRFRREAKAVGTLQHPNILTVYEFGVDGDRYYIAMEYLDGGTLRDKMDAKGKFTAEEAFAIMTEVLKGLDFAHSKGIIHRDIKPDNIQILADGRIKITDFGIARITFEPNLTVGGQTFGTPSYMSPEQVIGKDIDARSDQFSVGVILYEMTAGVKPFTGDSVVSLSNAIMNVNPPNIDSISYQADHVIHKALEKSPTMRFDSAAAMIDGMNNALAGQDVSPWGATMAPFSPYQPSGAPLAGSMPGVVNAPPPVIMLPPSGTTGYPGNYAQGYNPQYVPPSTYGQPINGPYMPPASSNAQYGYVPNPSGQPIYTVRPRKPMSAQTKNFFVVLIWSLVILVTVIVVMLVLTNAISSGLHTSIQQRADQQEVHSVQTASRSLPVSGQIQTVKDSLPKLSTPIAKEEQTKYLASLYAIQAKSALDSRDYATAEEKYCEAMQNDPDNVMYIQGLSTVYQQAAQSVKDIQNREILWHQSVQVWLSASQTAQTPSVRSNLVRKAAQADLGWAQALINNGSFEKALDPIEMAERLNISDPYVSQQISQMKATAMRHLDPQGS